MTITDTSWLLSSIRASLMKGFTAETAHPSCDPEWWASQPPSAGHCAAAAAIVSELTGCQMVSATVEGQSHWYNRMKTHTGTIVDVDFTADQFDKSGRPRYGNPGESLYPDSRGRTFEDLDQDTYNRAQLLAIRSGFPHVAIGLSIRRDRLYP